ncbi:MAG: HAMP domain-containing histidine kinase [Aphanothece sp. CMT-3BRIN-NPC111]|jgi:signal transduction histidine kinase|nr:HAMP domain-containing histidine kinase [Aphanothece sp. CMT-3BRIN-NPC111]
MGHNKLFRRTRWQLACWYTAVMGAVLAVCGLGVYEAIVQVHLETLDRELKSVAGTLHDSLENTFKQPEGIKAIREQLLPKETPKSHLVGAIYQGNYYLRLIDISGKIVVTGGFEPSGLPKTSGEITWQTLQDAQGIRYHQISLPLHTQDHKIWGYMQMGRSLKELDKYLATLKLILVFGLPIAMILIGSASLGLAGLAMQPIYRSYKQTQQFTADAAHELRTPLAAIQATVESALLMPELSEKEAREILGTVERQNSRLTQLVGDLLLLARMDRQPLIMSPSLCCLNDIVSDLVEELTFLASAANVTLEQYQRIPRKIYVFGDETQLYRLFSNLIANGIQYNLSGGKVTVILDKCDRHAVIQVQDTGIGISPKEQARIFDRFYRVNSDRSRHTGGVGLGLAIAMAIIQRHQAGLQLKSEPGKGTTFTIRLLIAKER